MQRSRSSCRNRSTTRVRRQSADGAARVLGPGGQVAHTAENPEPGRGTQQDPDLDWSASAGVKTAAVAENSRRCRLGGGGGIGLARAPACNGDVGPRVAATIARGPASCEGQRVSPRNRGRATAGGGPENACPPTPGAPTPRQRGRSA